MIVTLCWFLWQAGKGEIRGFELDLEEKEGREGKEKRPNKMKKYLRNFRPSQSSFLAGVFQNINTRRYVEVSTVEGHNPWGV